MQEFEDKSDYKHVNINRFYNRGTKTIFVVGDTHGKKLQHSFEIDAIFHIGDFTDHGKDLEEMLEYFNSLRIPFVFLHGNHEEFDGISFTNYAISETIEKILRKRNFSNLIYLNNKIIEFFGVVVGGSPGGGYDLNYPNLEDLEKRLSSYAYNIDILLTHVPPYLTFLDILKVPFDPQKEKFEGIIERDETGYKKWKHIGNVHVRDFVEKYEPQYLFCGHIHELSGEAFFLNSTLCVNVSNAPHYLTFEVFRL